MAGCVPGRAGGTLKPVNIMLITVLFFLFVRKSRRSGLFVSLTLIREYIYFSSTVDLPRPD